MNKSSVLGVYDDEDKLLKAIHSIQDKGYQIRDVISPFPIHHVFEALKLKTRIPFAAFLYGILGLIATFGFLYWTSVVNYPLVFGGKPQNTLSFIIVIFVMVINIATALTIITFFLREKKGPGAKPKLEYPGITDDRFLILVERNKTMSAADIATISKILKQEGALEIKDEF
jgi:hypothetical protein